MSSNELALDLGADGTRLRFREPASGRWVPTPAEARVLAEAAREQADLARRKAEAENEKLLEQLAELRRRLGGTNS